MYKWSLQSMWSRGNWFLCWWWWWWWQHRCIPLMIVITFKMIILSSHDAIWWSSNDYTALIIIVTFKRNFSRMDSVWKLITQSSSRSSLNYFIRNFKTRARIGANKSTVEKSHHFPILIRGRVSPAFKYDTVHSLWDILHKVSLPVRRTHRAHGVCGYNLN